MNLLSFNLRNVTHSLLFAVSTQLIFSPSCFAGEVLGFLEDEVIAVSSLEHSTHLTFNYPAEDILSMDSLGKNRADLICRSNGFEYASSYTTRKSDRAGEFTVYEGSTPDRMVLPVVNLIEFIDADGIVITFSQKAALQNEDSRRFKRHHSKKKVPHLLFSQITCENTAPTSFL